MSVRKFAQEMRIATAVIEALERGSVDRLPEHAYLSSMLPQLERRLVPTPGFFTGPSSCCGPAVAHDAVAALVHPEQNRCFH